MIDSAAPQHPNDREPDHDESWDNDPEVPGMLWHVGPGQAAGLLAAYRQAVRQADELADAFDRTGIGGELLTVNAGLDAAGQPMVTGVVTWAGARRLAALLAAGTPPPGLALLPGRPPWAA